MLVWLNAESNTLKSSIIIYKYGFMPHFKHYWYAIFDTFWQGTCRLIAKTSSNPMRNGSMLDATKSKLTSNYSLEPLTSRLFNFTERKAPGSSNM